MAEQMCLVHGGWEAGAEEQCQRERGQRLDTATKVISMTHSGTPKSLFNRSLGVNPKATQVETPL